MYILCTPGYLIIIIKNTSDNNNKQEKNTIYQARKKKKKIYQKVNGDRGLWVIFIFFFILFCGFQILNNKHLLLL